MANGSALVHDLERSADQWRALLREDTDLPVIERAYRAVVVLLMTAGLRGLAGVKTAEVAELTGINESTLFRYIDKRDQLVADSVDWCWKKVNESVAQAHHQRPLVESTAADMIMADMTAFLDMFRTNELRLYGTGALLSFRRAEHLIGDFEPVHQLQFRSRLVALCTALIRECNSNDHDPELIATYLTNYLATVWFTWLADPESGGQDGLLGVEMVNYHMRTSLQAFAACSTRRDGQLAG